MNKCILRKMSCNFILVSQQAGEYTANGERYHLWLVNACSLLLGYNPASSQPFFDPLICLNGKVKVKFSRCLTKHRAMKA